MNEQEIGIEGPIGRAMVRPVLEVVKFLFDRLIFCVNFSSRQYFDSITRSIFEQMRSRGLVRTINALALLVAGVSIERRPAVSMRDNLRFQTAGWRAARIGGRRSAGAPRIICGHQRTDVANIWANRGRSIFPGTRVPLINQYCDRRPQGRNRGQIGAVCRTLETREKIDRRWYLQDFNFLVIQELRPAAGT